LNTVNSQISGLRNNIANIKQDIIYVNDNLPKYKEFQSRGLFLDQDRFMAGRLLEDMRKKTDIPSFSFTIEDLKDIPNADAETVNYRLVSSRIRVERISAVFDNNVYVFLQEIAKSFPEHTRVQKFDLRRLTEVNEQTLKDITEGKQKGIIEANVVFDWMTMVKKQQEQPVAPGGTQPPAPGFRGR
jgi:hypothetical protein